MQRLNIYLQVIVLSLILLFGKIGGTAQAAEMKIGLFENAATIALIGPIVKGDFDRFKSTIQDVVDDKGVVTHLYIYSPGGSVNEAIKIGQLVSRLAMTTVAPAYDPAKPELRHCAFRESKSAADYKDYNWTYNKYTRKGERRCNCASACFLIWAAGANRNGSYLGIHRAFFKPEFFKKDSYQIARKRYIRIRKDVEEYLEEMNVPNLVVDTMFSIASNEIEPLAPNFVEVLQGGPALEEYLRAHCPTQTKARDLQQAVLDAAKATNLATSKIQAAKKDYDRVYLNAYRCEVKIRREIFNAAWARE